LILLSVRMRKQPILVEVQLGGEIAKSELQSRVKILLTTRKGAQILPSVRMSKQPILGIVLWALKWARQNFLKQTCPAQEPQKSACHTFRDLSVHTDRQTDGHTDMTRSTWLVILIKFIYILWVRKRFLLPVIYFPTNLVYFYSTSNLKS